MIEVGFWYTIRIVIKQRYNSGQSLIEAVIGLGISVIMISAATGSLFLVLRSGNASEQNQSAGSFANGLLDNVRAFSEAQWSAVYVLPKAPPLDITKKHYLTVSSGQFIITQGAEESLAVNNITYRRYFYLENVSRDGNGDIEPVFTPSREDPSTQKIVVGVDWDLPTQPGHLEITSYITRWGPRIAKQTDWSSGGATAGPVSDFGSRYFTGSGNADITSSPGVIRISGYTYP